MTEPTFPIPKRGMLDADNWYVYAPEIHRDGCRALYGEPCSRRCDCYCHPRRAA